MRIFSLVVALVLFFTALVSVHPAGAVVSSVSGEGLVAPLVRPKVDPDTRKKIVLQKKIKEVEKKIKEVQKKITRNTLAIQALEKKMESAKMTKVARRTAERKLKTLQTEKTKLESTLKALEGELARLGN